MQVGALGFRDDLNSPASSSLQRISHLPTSQGEATCTSVQTDTQKVWFNPLRLLPGQCPTALKSGFYQIQDSLKAVFQGSYGPQVSGFITMV